MSNDSLLTRGKVYTSITAQWFVNELEKQDAYGDPKSVKKSIFCVHHNQTIQVLAEHIGFLFENIEDTWRSHNICTLRKRKGL
jgi:hypothetical protein